jgi:hypothetical protein
MFSMTGSEVPRGILIGIFKFSLCPTQLRHGKPARVLIGFQSEDDWFDYRLEHDPRFRKRIEASRRSLREGEGTRREEIKGE